MLFPHSLVVFSIDICAYVRETRITVIVNIDISLNLFITLIAIATISQTLGTLEAPKRHRASMHTEVSELHYRSPK